MPPIFLLPAAGLLAAGGAVGATHLSQVQRRRHDEENERIRLNPRAWLQQRAAVRDADLAPQLHRRGRLEARIAEAREQITEIVEPAAKGVRLLIEGGALVALLALMVMSALLNIEIFVALAGGVVSAAPVLKGIGATVAEVGLALLLANTWHSRDPLSLAWKVQLAGVVLLLSTLVIGVATFAPQRSAQAWATQIDMDRRNVELNQADPTAKTAALDTLKTDEAREKRAEHSDAAQAVAFPVVEVLIAGLALEGAVAVGVMTRRKALDLKVRDLTAKHQRLDERIATSRSVFVRDTAARLIEVGIDPSDGSLALGPDAGPPAAGPPADPDTAPPAEPGPPRAVVRTDLPGSGPIDIKDFPPPPAAPPPDQPPAQDPPAPPTRRWGMHG